MREPTPRLGRGLAALLGETRTDTSSAPVGEIAPGQIDPNPFQPRTSFDPADIEELANSIRTTGLLQPLLVRPHPIRGNRYQIIAGERRWRAATLVGLATIPCLVRPMKDGEAAAAALVENLQRRDLNAMEEAEGFRKLIEEVGLSHDELGAAIGKSRSHVANVLRLLQLPEAVAAHVRSGVLSAGHARAALAYADPEHAAGVMIRNGLNVRQAESLRREDADRVRTQASRATSVADPDRAAIEADLAERLGMRVDITFNGAGGVVKLRYRTLDQLDHIVAKLGR